MTDEKKKPQFNMKTLLICMGVGLIVSIALGQQKSTPPTATQIKENQERRAAYVCREFIEKKLRDPRSAVYDHTKRFVIQKSDNVWIATITFTAKNAFNGTVKNTMQCEVQRESNGDYLLLKMRALSI